MALSYRTFTFIFVLLSIVSIGKAQTQVKKTSSATAKTGPLKTQDYDFYVLMLNQAGLVPDNLLSSFYTPYYKIIDIRTGNIVVKAWPAGDTYLSKSRNLLVSTTSKWPLYTSTIVSLDTSGLVLGKTDAKTMVAGKNYAGSFSPDFRSVLFQIENDLWLSQTDISKGKTGIPKQLTRFGFQGEQQIWGWYKDGVVLGQRYWINNKTGDVQDINVPEDYKGLLTTFNPLLISSVPEHHFSIDRRFVIYGLNPMQENWGGNIIDLSDNKLLNPDPKIRIGAFSFSYWLKNHQFMLYDKLSGNGTAYNILNNGQFEATPLPVSTFPGEDPRAVKAVGLSKIMLPQTIKFGRLCFSPDTTKYLLKREDGICNSIQGGGNDCEWYLYEPLIGQVKLIDKALVFVSWLDNDHLIYCKNGTTSEQGTYIHDLKTNSNKRLFSYIIDNAYDMQVDKVIYNQKSNFVLFGANQTLWRCRPDGSELTELLKGITSDITVKPFLTGMID